MAPSRKFWMAMPMGEGPGEGDLAVSGEHAGEHHAHCHPLGDVVEGDRQHQHGQPLEAAVGALRLLAAQVQVGDQLVHQQQKGHAQQKAHRRRQEGQPPQMGGLVHGGDEQGPHRGGHHHPGGKAQKGLLHQGMDLVFQEKDAPRAQRGAKQGEEQP